MNNGYGYFELYYNGQMCLSAADALMKFQTDFPDYYSGPEMEGDPHVKTWGGRWFDYHGECDLVLLHVPSFHNGKDLNIHVRTTIR